MFVQNLRQTDSKEPRNTGGLTRFFTGADSRETARFELKFVTGERAYHDLEDWLRRHSEAFVRPFPSRRVNTVYFDRFGYDSYGDSTQGVSSRVKVRYRWYGDSALPESGQLEVKVRRNRLGWKHCYSVNGISCPSKSWAEVNECILGATPAGAGYWLLEYPHPIVLCRYYRDYWVSRSTGIRATIDRNQSIYDQRYSTTINVSTRTEIPRTVVLEVKGPAGAEAAISQLVSDLPLPLSRHSKYCGAVDALHGF